MCRRLEVEERRAQGAQAAEDEQRRVRMAGLPPPLASLVPSSAASTGFAWWNVRLTRWSGDECEKAPGASEPLRGGRCCGVEEAAADAGGGAVPSGAPSLGAIGLDPAKALVLAGCGSCCLSPAPARSSARRCFRFRMTQHTTHTARAQHRGSPPPPAAPRMTGEGPEDELPLPAAAAAPLRSGAGDGDGEAAAGVPADRADVTPAAETPEAPAAAVMNEPSAGPGDCPPPLLLLLLPPPANALSRERTAGDRAAVPSAAAEQASTRTLSETLVVVAPADDASRARRSPEEPALSRSPAVCPLAARRRRPSDAHVPATCVLTGASAGTVSCAAAPAVESSAGTGFAACACQHYFVIGTKVAFFGVPIML